MKILMYCPHRPCVKAILYGRRYDDAQSCCGFVRLAVDHPDGGAGGGGRRGRAGRFRKHGGAATADPSRKYGGLASLPYIYKEIYRFPGRHRHGRDARLSIHGKPRGGADTEGRGREHVFGMDRRQGRGRLDVAGARRRAVSDRDSVSSPGGRKRRHPAGRPPGWGIPL